MKKILICLLVLALLAAVYFFGIGFTKQDSAFVTDWSVSEDGSQMTLRLGVSSSIGYIRKVSVQQNGSSLYLDCFRAFGGINGSLGAKSEYTIPLNDSVQSICLHRAPGYQQVLVRNSDGSWQLENNEVPGFHLS